jgi:membrane-bound ClpP family serine protease
MQLNVGSTDRLIRIILGAALIALPLFGIVSSFASTLGIVMAIVGAVFVVTGFVSFCPLYRIIGASTKSDTQ